MTTRELYSSIGVSCYEHQACWRKGGIFHIQMDAPAGRTPLQLHEKPGTAGGRFAEDDDDQRRGSLGWSQ